MSEGSDYNPGPWGGYSFSDARKRYDVHVGRSYNDAVSSNIETKKMIPESLKTESESPLVIACDVTGSMGGWPATMFSKLPYLVPEHLNLPGGYVERGIEPGGDSLVANESGKEGFIFLVKFFNIIPKEITELSKHMKGLWEGFDKLKGHSCDLQGFLVTILPFGGLHKPTPCIGYLAVDNHDCSDLTNPVLDRV